MNNPKLIIFEGMDRTGKTTLMKKVWELRGRIDCCVDRYIVSNIVYNKHYNRNISSINYLDFLPDRKDVVVVYLYTAYSDYKLRALKTNEEVMPYKEWKNQEKLFDDCIDNLEKAWLTHGKIIKISNYNNYDNLDILAQEIVNEIGD